MQMDTDRLKIRPAQREDLDAMVSLLQTLFAVEKDFRPDPLKQRKGLIRFLEGCGKHRCIMVAESENGVVGMATIQILISTAEGGPVGLVEDVVVQKAHRGRGIGRRLMSTVTGWAAQRGLMRLQLLADRTNFSALDFYHTIGWLPTSLICLRRKGIVN
jgi:GNAT superfamily N-acetyltransferase